jgi:hypothetical protein
MREIGGAGRGPCKEMFFSIPFLYKIIEILIFLK